MVGASVCLSGTPIPRGRAKGSVALAKKAKRDAGQLDYIDCGSPLRIKKTVYSWDRLNADGESRLCLHNRLLTRRHAHANSSYFGVAA